MDERELLLVVDYLYPLLRSVSRRGLCEPIGGRRQPGGKLLRQLAGRSESVCCIHGSPARGVGVCEGCWQARVVVVVRGAICQQQAKCDEVESLRRTW